MHYNRKTIPAKDESGLSGEELFVVAFLRLMVADARRQKPRRSTKWERTSDPVSAREFLRDTKRVAYWVELLDADVTVNQPQLLRAAGLARQEGIADARF